MRDPRRILSVALLMIFAHDNFAAETLEQAFAQAVELNHRLKAAQAETQGYEQQLYAAEKQRYPELNVSSGYTQLSETPTAKTDIEGQTAQFPTAQSGSVQAQAVASVPVFTSGRISHSIDAAEAALEAVQHNQTTTELAVKMQVSEAYITVLRVQSAVQVAQKQVESLSAHAQDVDNLYSQGMVSKNDQLAAQVELANARQRVLQSSNRLDIAKAQYNRLLNRSLEQAVNLEEPALEIPKGAVDELNHLAMAQRSELAALAKQIQAQQAQAQSVKAGLLPQVAVSGGYQYQENRFQTFEGMWMVNVGMQWKLDGSSHHRGEAFNRQALALQEQRDDLIGTINLEVKSAWLDIQETGQRIEVARQALAQADENIKVSRERYRQGFATNTEVLKAQELHTTSYDNLNSARYDAALAKLSLRRALGIL